MASNCLNGWATWALGHACKPFVWQTTVVWRPLKDFSWEIKLSQESSKRLLVWKCSLFYLFTFRLENVSYNSWTLYTHSQTGGLFCQCGYLKEVTNQLANELILVSWCNNTYQLILAPLLAGVIVVNHVDSQSPLCSLKSGRRIWFGQVVSCKKVKS